MEKEQKKTHSMFHCDQTNLSWFGPWVCKIFGKFQKAPIGKEEKKTHNQSHLNQTDRNWFKIGEPMVKPLKE